MKTNGDKSTLFIKISDALVVWTISNFYVENSWWQILRNHVSKDRRMRRRIQGKVKNM